MARTKRRLQDLMTRVEGRRGGVAVMVAIMVVALLGMLALAVDVSAAVSARTRLQEAADVAALTAVRQAAMLVRANTGADLTAAQNAGVQRFTAQASSTPRVAVNGITVDVTRNGLTITSTVRFDATYATQVAGVLNAISPGMTSLASLSLGGQAGAKQQVGAYVDIQVLMDTSNSMAIALADTKTPLGVPITSDTTNLMALTSQWPWYTWKPKTVPPTAGNPRPHLVYYPYIGKMETNCQFACHATLSRQDPDPRVFWLNPLSPAYGLNPLSPAYDPSYVGLTTLTTMWWMASSDNPTNFPPIGTYPDGKFTDFYALARKNGIRLRIDVLKQAVGTIINAVSGDEKVRFGFYTFDADPNVNPNASASAPGTYPVQAYPLGPASGAGTAVSSTEVTPYVWPQPDGSASQTNVAASITDFTANYAAQAGDGSSAQQPKKFAIIMTDGIEDFPGNTADPATGVLQRDYSAFDPRACDGLKAKGYTVIVLQAVSPDNFITSSDSIDAATLLGNVTLAMQQCASGPSYYFLASAPQDILNAAQAIVKLTLTQTTVITQGDTSTTRR